jgi:squalene-associated FAD-dependent desaturase
VRAVVVGGGIAGAAAALDLRAQGHEVMVLEARPTLGGAVQTLPEREGDPSPPPDNGQHIALGCCAAYLGFVEDLGQAASFERLSLDMPVIDERGRVASIGAGPVKLLRYGHLTVRERLQVARSALRLGKLDPAAHDGESFGAVLRRFGATDRSIERFWDIFIQPALNLPSDEAAASLGIFTVQTALLGPKGASDLVLPIAPLGAIHHDGTLAALRERGVEVRLGARVASLGDGAAMLDDGSPVPGDLFVVTLHPTETARLLGEPDPGLEDSPIVSVHLHFDRRILQPRLAALIGTKAQWVFDRGALTGHLPERGQYLTVVSSGVQELLEVRGRGVVDLVAGELTDRLGPAELLWSRVSREPRATFACRPGTAARRPGPATARPNVARAGAWTGTGWPATMESAVLSGRLAASYLASCR